MTVHLLNDDQLLCCSPASTIISANNPELAFQLAVKNKKENAYNTRVLVTFSENLYYSSVSPTVSERNQIWPDLSIAVVAFTYVKIFKALDCVWIFSAIIRAHHRQTEEVKCTLTQTQTVTCQVGYPALQKDQEVRSHGNRSSVFLPDSVQ